MGVVETVVLLCSAVGVVASYAIGRSIGIALGRKTQIDEAEMREGMDDAWRRAREAEKAATAREEAALNGLEVPQAGPYRTAHKFAEKTAADEVVEPAPTPAELLMDRLDELPIEAWGWDSGSFYYDDFRVVAETAGNYTYVYYLDEVLDLPTGREHRLWNTLSAHRKQCEEDVREEKRNRLMGDALAALEDK
jgi:hypothetical protein